MRNTLAFLILACVLCLSTSAPVAAQQTRTVTTPPVTTPTTMDDVLKDIRAGMQSKRADVLAKNLTLTAEQAAKFWPVFEQYQNAQNVIMDEQLKGIQTYAENYETLDDATALGLMNAHFDRDARMNALRQKWLGEFQKVLPTKLAVRAMQIDRRLSLVAQIELAARIPLVH